MRRVVTLLSAMAVALALSSTSPAQGKKGGSGKPTTTGLEHAESTANPHGQRGIENAEAKQAEHKHDKDKDKHKKKHHHKHHS